MEFITAYDPRVRKSFYTGSESVVQQSAKDECDINKIIARSSRTGLVSHTNQFQGEYLDLSEPVDFQSALNYVQQASDSFMSIPANIRKQFDNDPSIFHDFIVNPNNFDTLVDMGLAVRPATDDLDSVPEEPKE